MRLHEYVIATVMIVLTAALSVSAPNATPPLLAGLIGFFGDLILTEQRKR